MTSSDIWFEIFDKGSKGRYKQYSPIQQQLYYFIDFHIYMEMDGASGFLYNKSSSGEENLYAPYINCFIFFGYGRLAELLQQFHDQSVKRSKDDDSGDTWEDFLSAHDLEKIMDEFDAEAQRIMDDGCVSVNDWIDQNHDELIKGLT